MPTFAYRGRNAAGDAVEDVLEGATAAAVADLLFGNGITPLEIKPAPAEAKADILDRFGFFGDRVGHIDILLFSRQMYSLLKAGVPIMRALAGLQESTPNKAMKGLLGQVRESLDAGRELSVSLAWRGQQLAAGTRTAGLSGTLPTVEEIMFNKGKLYLDTGASYGSQKTGTGSGLR